MKAWTSYTMYLILAVFIPFADRMAVSDHSPTYTCMIYMFAHANIIHYLLNGASWLFLWRAVTVKRLAWAWIFSACWAYLLQPHTPTVGWSVVIYYFLGLYLAGMRKERAVRLILLTVSGFLLPHIAAGMHMCMLISGYIVRRVSIAWKRRLM